MSHYEKPIGYPSDRPCVLDFGRNIRTVYMYVLRLLLPPSGGALDLSKCKVQAPMLIRFLSLLLLMISTTAAAQSLQDRKQTWSHFDYTQQYTCVMYYPRDKASKTIIRKGGRATVVSTGIGGELYTEELTCNKQICGTAFISETLPIAYVSTSYLMYPEQGLAISVQVVHAPDVKEEPLIPVAAEYHLDCKTQK